MELKKRTLKIMIASPRDVIEERQAVRDVIKNINYWAVFANIEFASVDWENNTYPSLSDYPQNAINEQLKGKYDILIGILWSRIGTKTPMHESGSVEEIEIAIKESKRKNRVNVMLYFKTDEIPQEKVDTEQIRKLQSFKSSLAERGVYYWEFKSTTEFKSYISQHLALLVQHKYWINSKEKVNIDFISNKESDVYSTASDSLIDAINQRTKVHEIISLLAIFHGKESNQQNSENDRLTQLLAQPKSQETFNQIKKVMDESALRIREQATLLGKEVEDIKVHFIRMFNAYSNSILLNDELSKKEKRNLLASITSLIDLRESYENISKEVDKSIKLHKIELKDSRFPAYNRSLKEYLKVKINYSNIFKDSIYLMDELEKVFKNII